MKNHIVGLEEVQKFLQGPIRTEIARSIGSGSNKSLARVIDPGANLVHYILKDRDSTEAYYILSTAVEEYNKRP